LVFTLLGYYAELIGNQRCFGDSLSVPSSGANRFALKFVGNNLTKSCIARFEVLTAVWLKLLFFWDLKKHLTVHVVVIILWI